MNGQTILSIITEKKQNFLAQYEDKSYFKKKSSVFFTDFLNKVDRFGEGVSLFSILTFILTSGFLSIPVSSSIFEYVEYLSNSKLGPAIELPVTLFLFALFLFSSAKIITSAITTWKYHRRTRSNSIEQLFGDDFYDSEVSPEIKNMLKLFLPDDAYIEIRKRNNKITYRIAELAVKDIIERDGLLEEKREIFLTPEEIKQYSYVNAG